MDKQRLIDQGPTVPLEVHAEDVFVDIDAMIDTGASRTCVSHQLATELDILGYTTVEIARAVEPYTALVLEPFVLRMSGTGGEKVDVTVNNAITLPLDRVGVHVLLGRDVLALGSFKYDGLSGRYSMTLGEKTPLPRVEITESEAIRDANGRLTGMRTTRQTIEQGGN